MAFTLRTASCLCSLRAIPLARMARKEESWSDEASVSARSKLTHFLCALAAAER